MELWYRPTFHHDLECMPIIRLAVDMDIHGYIHGYIHVWI